MARAVKAKYPVLKIQISEKEYSQKQIAEYIGIHPRTFCMKLQGKQQFTLDEGLNIQNTFFPDISVNELFRVSKKS